MKVGMLRSGAIDSMRWWFAFTNCSLGWVARLRDEKSPSDGSFEKFKPLSILLDRIWLREATKTFFIALGNKSSNFYDLYSGRGA